MEKELEPKRIGEMTPEDIIKLSTDLFNAECNLQTMADRYNALVEKGKQLPFPWCLDFMEAS